MPANPKAVGRDPLEDAESEVGSAATLQFLTIGRVMDTNDPQQMGRVRALCPAFGDHDRKPIGQIPWSVSVSPLAGMTNFGARGAPLRGSQGPSEVSGPLAYGMWNVPSIGAYVLVGCVDGDSSLRFYVGCIHPQFLTHTQPHGRYTWGDTTGGKPDGPLDSAEKPIEPTYSNFTSQFQKSATTGPNGNRVPLTPNDPRRNMEYRTRAVDTQVSGVDSEIINQSVENRPGSAVADKDDANFDFTSVRQEDTTKRTIEGQGYAVSQLEPEREFLNTADKNFDSQIYSWQTPGFHAIAMDDRHWNCRMRFRTTAGHQIIMDDTNERIYVSTAEGRTWIELDQAGNIDIFADRNLSVRAAGDINFTTDQTFRVNAAKGIHMFTNDEFRMHSDKDMSLRTETNHHTHAVGDIRVETEQSYDLKATLDIHQDAVGGVLHLNSGSDTRITAGAEMDLKAAADVKITAGAEMDLLASGDIIGTGSQIHWNGPTAPAAPAADAAVAAEEKWSYYTSRVPEHEPWARVFMKESGAGGADNDGLTVGSPINEFTPEMDYTNIFVGRGSLTRSGDLRDSNGYRRNALWNR